jgi:hypothetical protein
VKPSNWTMLTGLPALLAGAFKLGGWPLALFSMGVIVVAKGLIEHAKETP